MIRSCEGSKLWSDVYTGVHQSRPAKEERMGGREGREGKEEEVEGEGGREIEIDKSIHKHHIKRREIPRKNLN